MKKPKVSVIIPCYNLGNYIMDALNSVLAQTYKNYEVIIVDDGSNDRNTHKILKKINNPKVKIYYQKNTGASATRNKAVSLATGKYICPLDGDDMIAPTYLEKAIKVLDENPRVGFVTPWIQHFEESNLLWKTEQFDIRKSLSKNITAVSSVYRRVCWEESGGYNTNLKGFEDWDFWINIGKRGWDGEIIPEPLFLYRDRKGSKYKTSNKAENRVRLYGLIINNHKDVFNRYYKDVLLDKEASIHQLNKRLSDMTNSNSWRITKPLRDIMDVVKAVKANGLLNTAKRMIPKTIKEKIKKKLAGHFYIADNYPIKYSSNKKWSAKKPIISVVIPCYNYGKYLNDAINSVLSSTINNLEIIIVDDGSTDLSTQEVLNSIDSPKISILHKKNGGPEKARNYGVEQARGKYICCLDADDTIEPTYFEKCIDVLETRKEIGFVYSWVRLFGDLNGEWCPNRFNIKELMLYNTVPTAAVFRRKIWRKIGGQNPNMHGGYEDWEMWLSMAERGWRGFAIPEKLFNHRRHGITLTHKANEKSGLLIKQLHNNHKIIYGNRRAVRAIIAKYSNYIAKNIAYNISDPTDYKSGDKPNLTYICSGLNFGGAQTMIIDVLIGLKERYSINIITTEESYNEWEDRFKDITSHIYHLPNYIINHEGYREKYILTLLKRYNTQKILISNNRYIFSALGSIKRELPNVKIFNLLHNDSIDGYVIETRDNEKYIDYTIGVNENIRELLVGEYGFSESKVGVILNGIDTAKKFNPSRYSRLKSFKKLNLPIGKKYVVWIGRFSEEKAPLRFIDIARQFKQDGKYHFVMAGDGPQFRLANRQARKIKNLTLLGYTREIPALLKIASVLVLTSRIEGMPITTLEALSMGVSVISTDVGNISSIIKNGFNGHVVSGDIVLKSKELIVACNKYDRKKIRQDAIEKYSNSKMIELYKRVI